MILIDAFCQKCENLKTDLVMESHKHKPGKLYCPVCNKKTQYEKVCGGSKSRYRFNDWDGVDFSGAIKYTGNVTAECEETGEQLKFHGKHAKAGQKISDSVQRSNDKIEEKRQKLNWKSKQKKGKNPIYIT